MVLNEPCACDLLIVGAGGNGGTGASSGGAGAGEVIYYPNFPLRNGTLNINVGVSSTTPSNRISSITHTSGTQISAKGGGDGGTFTPSIILPQSGGSGGGGAKTQVAATAGVKFDDYKSFALAGLNGNTTTGGNGGSGSSLYNTRYTTTITGSSLLVGLGGIGVGTIPATPTIKTNYGDGGDGNGGLGYQGVVIIRFKVDTNYLQVKAIKDNANAGLILNVYETPNAYQLRIFPWSDTYILLVLLLVDGLLDVTMVVLI